MDTQLERTVTPFDAARAEAFMDSVAAMANASALTTMIAIGKRTGLFETLASMPPADSNQIAVRSGLAERYVREWLAALVMGEIIIYEPEAQTYHLPPEHAASLTESGQLGDLGVLARLAVSLSRIEDDLVRCFQTGEGTNYHDYANFHEVMALDSAQTVVAGLFDHILPLVPGIDDRLRQGIDVLDAGCGRGRALLTLAEHYPNSRFTGYDLCADAIEWATGEAARRGLTNIRFRTKDMTGFDESARYDLVTSFDAVHDQKDPGALIAGLHQALRPGGTYLMQDIGGSARLENNRDFPMAALLYTISCLHCTPVSLGQGGKGLGTMWGWETAKALLEETGFSPVVKHVLPHDPMNVWFVAAKA